MPSAILGNETNPVKEKTEGSLLRAWQIFREVISWAENVRPVRLPLPVLCNPLREALPWTPSPNFPPRIFLSRCAATLRNSARRWPTLSTRLRPDRSSMPPKRRFETYSPTSDWPPTRPPFSSDSKPRKRLSPPPRNPATGKPLPNKGPQDHTVLTLNGRITLIRRRYAAPDVDSCFPLDCWLDQAEDTVSVGLREM